MRAVTSLLIGRAVGSRPLWPLRLLPVRDWLAAAIMVASASGTEVHWRGQTMHIAPHPTAAPTPVRSLSPGP